MRSSLLCTLKLYAHSMRPVRFLSVCVWFRDVTSFFDASGIVCVRVEPVSRLTHQMHCSDPLLLERRPYQTHHKRTWRHEIRRMRPKNAQEACRVHPAWRWMHKGLSVASLRYLWRPWRLTARVFNAHMLRALWMAQLRVARGWSSHFSGPCGKVGFFLLRRWNCAARWSVPMVIVDELQFVDVCSRGCFDNVYDSQLWTLWIGVRESNVQNTV